MLGWGVFAGVVPIVVAVRITADPRMSAGSRQDFPAQDIPSAPLHSIAQDFLTQDIAIQIILIGASSGISVDVMAVVISAGLAVPKIGTAVLAVDASTRKTVGFSVCVAVTAEIAVTFLVGMDIIIFNFVISPIGVGIMNFNLVRPITCSIGDIVNLEFQMASKTKSSAPQSEKDQFQR